MDQKTETQPPALRQILNPEARALVLAGDCYLARVRSQPQTIDLAHDPNWETQASIQPGVGEERRLYLSFFNNRDGRRVELKVSSHGLELAYYVLGSDSSGILEVRSAPVGQPQAAERDFLALRVLPALSLMKPSESRLLEGVLGLASGNERYQLSPRDRPTQVVSRLARPIAEPLPSPALPAESALRAEERKPRFYSLDLPGRSGQDQVVTFPVDQSQNPWGIYFLGGVFDGHGSEGASRLAEQALPVFWSFLERSNVRDLPTAIGHAAAQTNARLTQGFEPDAGTCAEIALLAREGIYQLHLGDGQQFIMDKQGAVRSANFPPHQLPEERKLGGKLRVNRSWGDADIRMIVGEEALSAMPEVRFLSWDRLRRDGIKGLMLTTDGLLDLVNHVDPQLPAKAMRDYFGPSSQAEIRQAMAGINRRFPDPGADDVSGLLLSFSD